VIEIAALTAERDAYRAALEEISVYDHGDSWSEIIYDLRDIARAALAKAGKE